MLDFVRTAVWPRIPTLRIASVNRLGLNRLLLRQFARLDAGCVLDVGAKGSPYTQVIPSTRYLRLDIDPTSEPDICCDIHHLDWKAHSFDTVVAVEVLEHLYAEISDLPAPDGPFIHPKAAERSKLLFVTASSRFRGRQLSSGGCATH